jgi:hypothetical protein
MNIPKQLISLLNSGRCIAIIGSGPSCEIGYPSWGQLVEKCLEHARSNGFPIDEPLFSRLSEKRDYPKIFKYLEETLTRKNLIAIINSHLKASQGEGRTYKLLAQWPFRLYMTTNWDSEIHEHLIRIGSYYSVCSNTRTEITQITDETTKKIYMLHGVLTDPGSMVITEDDYQEFKTGDSRRYFRETLKSILRTLPVVVIGHSMSDPDIQTILETARCIAPAHRPIYMIIGDPNKEDLDTFECRYNIRLVGYKCDPAYTGFFKLLRHISNFVVPRSGIGVRPLDPPSQQDIEVATSLLVFNSLGKSLDTPHLLDRLVYPQILQKLKQHGGELRLEEFASLLMPEAIRTLPTILDRVRAALVRLQTEGLVSQSPSGGWYLNQSGEDAILTFADAQRFEDDQVYGSLIGRLKSAGVPTADCDRAAQSLKLAIISLFRRRGMAAASLIFQGRTFDPIDMAEFFESVTTSVEWATSFELREKFIEFAVRLFTSPTSEERRYLARVSQGMFAVHVFGMDPSGVDARAQVFKAVSWFLDSNVLIHLLARGSVLNEMATSISQKCSRLGIRLFASKGVVEECLSSIEWASRMCGTLTAHEEMQFIFRVFHEDGYRRNPYIDGFVQCHQQFGLRRFSDYRKHIGVLGYDAIVGLLKDAGIEVVSLESLPTDDIRRCEFLAYKNQILSERERRRTSSGAFQADVEAEVMCLILAVRDQESKSGDTLPSALFVSTSRLLDQMFGASNGVLTWCPDVFFKHLSLISPSVGDTESLIEAMSTELSDLGVTLVDETAYRQYFDPLISSARMSFDSERVKYAEIIQDANSASIEELQAEFDVTPDLRKPLFISQMQFKIGMRGIAELEHELNNANRIQEELSTKLQLSEREWQERQSATVRHFENRIRNLSDPTRRKKLKRKDRNKRKRGK